MNVPWSGFPLSKLIEKAQPKSSARHVRFFTALKRDEMPGVREAHWYQWPYFEALRMDEAMNELAFVATGNLRRATGQAARCAAAARDPVEVRLQEREVDRQDRVRGRGAEDSSGQIQPHEYGYLSNVNPNIPHPRWSQATSHWLHNSQPFETPIFNGYGEYVSKLYPDEPTTMQRALRQGQVAR